MIFSSSVLERTLRHACAVPRFVPPEARLAVRDSARH
jgi:hypothetical protein